MSKKALWAEALIFLAFIGVFFILNLVLPDRQFSEQENRYLQMKPEFSFKSLFSATTPRNLRPTPQTSSPSATSG